MNPCHISLGYAAGLVLSSQMTKENHGINTKETVKVDITYQNSKSPPRKSETKTKSLVEVPDTFYSFPDTPPASEIEEIYSEEAGSVDQDYQQDDSFYNQEEDELYSSTDEDEFYLGKDEVLSEEEELSENEDEYNRKESAKSNYHDKKAVKSTIHDNFVTKECVKHDKPIITSKKTILSFAKLIFSLKRPAVLLHDLTFVTGTMQYEIIKSHINIGSLTQSKLAGYITKSDFISFMVTYKGQKGRWIFVMKKQYRDLLADEFNASLRN